MENGLLTFGKYARISFAVLFAAALGGCSTGQIAEPEPEEIPEPVKEEVKEQVTEKAAKPEPLVLEAVYFAYDDYELSRQAREALKRNVDKLLARPEVKITVDGHCDERGTDAYNLDLGWKRAYSVRDYLKRLGIDDSRIYPNSYGRARPATRGSGESVWSQNRRVESAEKK